MNIKISVAYHFYRRYQSGKDIYLGTLTEKRKNPERITDASIMNWAKLNALTARDVFDERVYYLREEIKSETWHFQK